MRINGTQRGERRGGIVHGEMDHGRKGSRAALTACSNMPERVGKDQTEEGEGTIKTTRVLEL